MTRVEPGRMIYPSSSPGAAELTADAVVVLCGIIVVVGGTELIVRGSARILQWIFSPDKESENVE